MRTIQTFVLRLLIDSDSPEALRGVIRSVTDNEEFHFVDGQTLLTLLRRLCFDTNTEPGARDALESKTHSEGR